MEGEKGSDGLMSHVDEIAIPILLESSKGSSDAGMQGGNAKFSSTGSESGVYSASNAVQDRESNGNNLRRRLVPKISESDSTLSELQIKSLSRNKSKFSQTKSRVVEVEQSESYELKNTSSSHPRGSLSQKIKSMRAGTLQPSEGKDEDDCDDKDDDDEDDDEEKEEEGEQKGDDLKSKKHRKFSKISKKLKAFDVIIEWILFIGAMVVFIASLYADDLKTRVVWGLEIWKWCVLVAVIFCGRLVTGWAKDAIVFLIESKFLFNERVVYFLHGVKQSVRVAIWLALVLVAWVLLIDRSVKRSKETNEVLNYITKALISSLVGAVMWMAKTLIVKSIAAAFHVKTFFAKIREAISDEYVLWILSVPPSLNTEENGGRARESSRFFGLKTPKWLDYNQKKEEIEEESQQQVKLEKKNSHLQQEGNITLKKLGKMKPGKMPASTMGQLIDRIKSSKLSIVSSALYVNVEEGGEQIDITSRSAAETAASLIFQNVRRGSRK